MQRGLKEKTIIATTFGLDEFLRVSQCYTAKKMWDNPQITNEGITKIKRTRLNILTDEYEIFRMKSKENLYQMQTQFTYIGSHMKILVKTFLNDD